MKPAPSEVGVGFIPSQASEKPIDIVNRAIEQAKIQFADVLIRRYRRTSACRCTTIDALEAKYQIAANSAAANYSFYLGATNDNLEEIKKLDPKQSLRHQDLHGASTGNSRSAFECFSAYSTVGLSLNYTPTVSRTK